MNGILLSALMCANADANVSSSMSNAVRVKGMACFQTQSRLRRVHGHRHVYCSGQDAQTKSEANGGGELEIGERWEEPKSRSEEMLASCLA